MPDTLAKLDAEWRTLATSPRARHAVSGWARHHRGLDGHRDLNEVLASRRDPQVAGDALQALATLAPTDELAARTLLQMLLPGLVRLIATEGRGDNDATDDMIALAWERIRTYPTTRRGSVAGNVVLDVRKRYIAARRADRDTIPSIGIEPTEPATSTEDIVIGRLLLEDIDAACSAGVLSRDIFETIVRTRVAGESLADIATASGVEPQVLCQRRWRAERRLRRLDLAA